MGNSKSNIIQQRPIFHSEADMALKRRHKQAFQGNENGRPFMVKFKFADRVDLLAVDLNLFRDYPHSPFQAHNFARNTEEKIDKSHLSVHFTWVMEFLKIKARHLHRENIHQWIITHISPLMKSPAIFLLLNTIKFAGIHDFLHFVLTIMNQSLHLTKEVLPTLTNVFPTILAPEHAEWLVRVMNRTPLQLQLDWVLTLHRTEQNKRIFDMVLNGTFLKPIIDLNVAWLGDKTRMDLLADMMVANQTWNVQGYDVIFQDAKILSNVQFQRLCNSLFQQNIHVSTLVIPDTSPLTMSSTIEEQIRWRQMVRMSQWVRHEEQTKKRDFSLQPAPLMESKLDMFAALDRHATTATTATTLQHDNIMCAIESLSVHTLKDFETTLQELQAYHRNAVNPLTSVLRCIVKIFRDRKIDTQRLWSLGQARRRFAHYLLEKKQQDDLALTLFQYHELTNLNKKIQLLVARLGTDLQNKDYKSIDVYAYEVRLLLSVAPQESHRIFALVPFILSSQLVTGGRPSIAFPLRFCRKDLEMTTANMYPAKAVNRFQMSLWQFFHNLVTHYDSEALLELYNLGFRVTDDSMLVNVQDIMESMIEDSGVKETTVHLPALLKTLSVLNDTFKVRLNEFDSIPQSHNAAINRWLKEQGVWHLVQPTATFSWGRLKS